MAWDKGFNFRQTSGYVTDGANSTYVLSADTYPTTRNGVTFGWDVSPTGDRDRDSALDARLAGIAFGSGVGTFRVDLPSGGTFNISMAVGDATAIQEGNEVIVKDGTSPVITIGPHDTGSAEFYDALDVAYTAANWPANNDPSSEAFSSSILRLTLEPATTNSAIAHLFVSQVTVTPRFILGTH